MGAGAVLQFVRAGLLLSDSLYWIGYRPGAARVIQVDTVAPRKALGISHYLNTRFFSLFLRLLNDLLD
jgi:hypothetical protein